METYEMPKDGWVCFHCGERFTTPGGAEDHFGAKPNSLAGCQIKVGEERGLLMELRRVEKDREFLWDLLDDIDTVSDAAKSDDAGYRRAVTRIQSRRHEVGESLDGQTITWKNTGLHFDRPRTKYSSPPLQPPLPTPTSLKSQKA